MDSSGKIATTEAPRTQRNSPDESRPSLALSPGTILLVSIWIGLVAGMLDLGLLIARNRMGDRDFYHLGEDFVWIIPAGVAALTLIPGTLLAILAGFRRGLFRPRLAIGILGFFGFLDVGSRFPFDFWAIVLLSIGLAIQSSRWIARHPGTFLTLVRRTAPLLIGALLTVILIKVGGRAWSDHRTTASLPAPPRNPRNVLVIVWDTVRAANTSLHGYHRRTTPNLEKLANRGVHLDKAFATSSWTLPSHASLFTGRWPHELGVDWSTPLRPDVPTLAEYLGHRGYDSAGFVANLDYCGRESGLARGFAHYEDFPLGAWDVFNRYIALGRRLQIDAMAFTLDEFLERFIGRATGLAAPSKEHARDAAAVNEGFLEWLTWQQKRRRPFFAFLNFNDAHSPYVVPDPTIPGFGLRPSSSRDLRTLAAWTTVDKAILSPRDVRMATDLYDDCIAELDRRLGTLIEELGRRGVLDDTVVIVTSDHGEHLGDHRLFFHGCSLYRQLVQVPLVIVGPVGVPAGRKVTSPASLRDVPATVVELLGLGPETPFPGRSLSRFWGEPTGRASPGANSEPLLMETGKPLFLANQGREPAAKGPLSSLITSGMHYIRWADRSEELFLLDSDPEERTNLSRSPTSALALPGLRKSLASMFAKR